MFERSIVRCFCLLHLHFELVGLLVPFVSLIVIVHFVSNHSAVRNTAHYRIATTDEFHRKFH